MGCGISQIKEPVDVRTPHRHTFIPTEALTSGGLNVSSLLVRELGCLSALIETETLELLRNCFSPINSRIESEQSHYAIATTDWRTKTDGSE